MEQMSYGLGNAGPAYPSREGDLMRAREQEKMEEAKKIAAVLMHVFHENSDLKDHPGARELLCNYHVRGELQKIDPNFVFPEVS